MPILDIRYPLKFILRELELKNGLNFQIVPSKSNKLRDTDSYFKSTLN